LPHDTPVAKSGIWVLSVRRNPPGIPLYFANARWPAWAAPVLE
jgi:hypothetical protein